jgi:hypothetical protein
MKLLDPQANIGQNAEEQTMKISTYSMTVETFAPMLASLANVLDKANQFAEVKKIDPSVLVNSRLAPDMFPLSTQVRIACRYAKAATALLSGRNDPEIDGALSTLADLKTYIEKTIAFVKTAKPSEFEGADERDVVWPWTNNLEFAGKGGNFLKDWALPQFYFHVTTAYDILRHSGVEIGKRDYLSDVASCIRPRT